MRPLTETIPKPMLLVAGKPFLQHQIELLVRHGIVDIVLLVGYLSEQVEQFFGKGERFGCRIAYSYEKSLLGTGGAVKNAEPLLASHFFLLNGDTYLDLSYEAMARDFRAANVSALVAAYRPDSAGRLPSDRVACNLTIDTDGRVLAYRKKQPEGLTHVDAGVLALRKSVLDKFPDGAVLSLEQDIYPGWIAEGQMRAWVTREPFYDMGSPEGLAALAEKLS